MRRDDPRATLRILAAASCIGWPAIGQGRTVVDMAGQSVTAPDHPARIADLWFAHNAVTIMLGAAGRIAVTNDLPTTRPWMYRVAPDLYRATGVVGALPNVEMLRHARVDITFVSSGSPALETDAADRDAGGAGGIYRRSLIAAGGGVDGGGAG